MNITVIGRQFAITPSIRIYVEEHIGAELQDMPLKVTSVNVVMVREKNRFKSSIVVKCKYHVITSEVEGFDLYKTFDEALGKVTTQLSALRERIHEHKTMPLCDAEAERIAVETEE